MSFSVLVDIYTARVTIYYLTARYFLRPLARITYSYSRFLLYMYTCVQHKISIQIKKSLLIKTSNNMKKLLMVAMALIVACSVTMAQDAKQLRKECIVYKVLNSSSHYFLPPLAQIPIRKDQ